MKAQDKSSSSGQCCLQSPSNVSAAPSLSTIASSSPFLSSVQQVEQFIVALQQYLTSFSYNASGPEFTAGIQLIKSQPMRVVAAAAQRIMRARLPIKCLEAVVVALHCTASLPSCSLLSSSASLPSLPLSVTRLPVRFYTSCAGHRYWHIVLVLAVSNSTPSPAASTTSSPAPSPRPAKAASVSLSSTRYAAVSLSRHPPLSCCPLIHPSLSSLCSAFRAEYRRIGHRLLRLTVGLPMPAGDRGTEPLHWHFLLLKLSAAAAEEAAAQPACRHEEAEEKQEQEEQELQVSPLPSVPAKEGEAVRAEWRTARVLLDRYAAAALSLLALVRHNLSHSSTARPLPALHACLHFHPSLCQLVYDGWTEGRAADRRQQPQAAQQRSRGEEKELLHMESVDGCRSHGSRTLKLTSDRAKRSSGRAAFAV